MAQMAIVPELTDLLIFEVAGREDPPIEKIGVTNTFLAVIL
jgi:hypothetical protein